MKKQQKSDFKTNSGFPGYPLYPAEEDIYRQYHKESEVDPEDPSRSKVQVDPDELDVPGAELDNDSEQVGSEDEENNYYSLGGDNHTDLDENNGDY